MPHARLAALAWLALICMCLSMSAPAAAQKLPALTGRVVDAADMLPADREAALATRLQDLEQRTSRQLVVVTVPNLQGYSIDDFGYRLGETWKLGDKEADNGAILLIAKDDRKIRIEVGDGLEPILTDAMSGMIIRNAIRPAFQAGDYPAGIEAGVDAIIKQLSAPPEQAEQAALQAAERQRQGASGETGSLVPLIFWIVVFVFIVIPMIRGRRRGRRHRRRGVWIWGPGLGGGGGWSSGGSSWGGGGGGWGGGGGGGGFSGGGGSFGGGGASGGW